MSLVEGLEEGASPAPSRGSPLLQERATYVLVQIISKWGPRLSLVVMLKGKRRAAVQRLPTALLSPHFARDLALTLPIQCAVLTPAWAANRVRVKGGGGAHQAREPFFLPPEGEGGAPTRYESLLEKLDDWCPELAGECHGRAWGGGGTDTFSPAWTGRASWALQRSCAGCRAYPPWAMAGGGVWALGMATRSKALLQGPEGWAPCHPGPDSGGQEPGKEETWTSWGILASRSGAPSQGIDMC